MRPFTRIIHAPPGWPWDQTRAAKLEAHHTSPISGDGITIIVRRLKSWSFGDTGEFVAVYLRTGDTSAEEDFDIEVQGQRLRIEVPSRAARETAIREQAWQLGAGLVIAFALASLSMLAWQRRAALEDHLDSADMRVAHEVRDAKTLQRAKADAYALGTLDLKDQTAGTVLQDIEKVAMAKNDNARIDAFYWRKGYWAVEAHGDAPPVKGMDLNLQKSTKPVRKDVWLWMVSDGGASK